MFGPYSSDPWIITNEANETYWEGQSVLSGTEIEVDSLDTFGFSRVTLVFTRTTPTGTREDDMTAGLSWASAAGGVAVPLSSAEMASIETALGTWWGAVKSLAYSGYTLAEYVWHEYQPITSRPGPAVRTTTVGVVGTSASGRLPDQDCFTTTYKTASRKHWGRSYWPTTSQGFLDSTYGRWTSGSVTTLLNATKTLLDTDGSSDQVTSCVASIKYPALLGIRELQVDNIVDIQRRRRAKEPTIRSTATDG